MSNQSKKNRNTFGGALLTIIIVISVIILTAVIIQGQQFIPAEGKIFSELSWEQVTQFRQLIDRFVVSPVVWIYDQIVMYVLDPLRTVLADAL
jgi:predicted membrane channel-forming protein YqfA (hemolysin III family)